MSILTTELESTMYSTVMQTQLAVGTSMQRGLKIPITLTQCLEPQPWNKLEIPESLNGEGVTIAIMASQGGFLLFIPDDGILLPAGYAMTLSDPTEPLPVMAGELQRKLVPDAPEYVGKRIGRAKVFSSMARRAGIDDSAMILPVKLVIGDQESHVWFVGDVPHPERAFAKRNPDSESRSKKSKLFSDEILSNYSAEPDFMSMFSGPESKENLKTPLVLDSETEMSLHGGKTNRQKADLNRLLALKKNYGNELPRTNIQPLAEAVEPEVKLIRIDSPHEHIESKQSLENTSIQPLVEPEKVTTPVDAVLAEPQQVEDIQTIDYVPIEETIVDINKRVENIIVDETSENIPEQSIPEDVIPNDITEPLEEVVEQLEENIIEPVQQTISKNISDNIGVNENGFEKPVPIPANPVFRSMTVPLEAVVSLRHISLNEIIRWKPGSVIEFGELSSTVSLMAKNVVLAHGQPVEYNSQIGLQMK